MDQKNSEEINFQHYVDAVKQKTIPWNIFKDFMEDLSFSDMDRLRNLNAILLQEITMNYSAIEKFKYLNRILMIEFKNFIQNYHEFEMTKNEQQLEGLMSNDHFNDQESEEISTKREIQMKLDNNEVENGKTLEVKLEDNENMVTNDTDFEMEGTSSRAEPKPNVDIGTIENNVNNIKDDDKVTNGESLGDKLEDNENMITNNSDFEIKNTNTREKEFNPEPKSKADTEIQCYYCGDMFFYKNIQEHMKLAHGRFHRKMFGAPRPLQCEVCHATFEKQSALTSHSCYTNFIPTKVRGGDPYKCDICKKTFTVKMGLRSHLNTIHNEERKFACVNCYFKAKSIVILNRHVERVHKNNLKHLCTHCNKKFFRAYDLRCHIHRVHKDIEGTKGQTCNFKCEDCNERFLDRRALNCHKKKHVIPVIPSQNLILRMPII